MTTTTRLTRHFTINRHHYTVRRRYHSSPLLTIKVKGLTCILPVGTTLEQEDLREVVVRFVEAQFAHMKQANEAFQTWLHEPKTDEARLSQDEGYGDWSRTVDQINSENRQEQEASADLRRTSFDRFTDEECEQMDAEAGVEEERDAFASRGDW